MKIRERTWQVLEATKSSDKVGRYFNYFIFCLISLNVVAVIIGTVDSIQSVLGGLLDTFEVFSVVIFSIEYLSRLWSCVSEKRYSKPILGRLRFFLRPMSVIDLLAILPFFLPFFVVDARAIRIFRLIRIIRVAKIGRYQRSLRLFTDVLYDKKEELVLCSTLLVMTLIFSSCVMYFCEGGAQPDKFSSIPQTLWWSVSTLTTVGYGDIYPVTNMGKLFGGIISILGICMFALPTGILGAGLMEQVQNKKTSRKRCPHCGEEIN